ncbi:TPA: hypothetical protein JD264_01850 [Serratia fonticola]|nr:hypothetical protein [Serratia fonticola]
MIITSELCELAGMESSQAMLEKIPSWIDGNISEPDQPLLIGLTKLLKPQKVVEIGVASGWSGCLFIEALNQNAISSEYFGIDLSPKYYLDTSRDTGSAIFELFPDTPVKRRMLFGNYAIDNIDTVGKDIDLAFIDGDHRHPFAILDLLSLLPNMKPNSYVLLHDINLSTFERHKQKNRGPKYLFECWPFQKIHSSQYLPMIGALEIPDEIDDGLLTLLLNTVSTPWEKKVEPDVLEKIALSLSNTYGRDWGNKFISAFRMMNNTVAISNEDKLSRNFISKLINNTKSISDVTARLEIFISAIAIFPYSSQLHHNISVLRFNLGDLDGAIASATKAIELDETNPHYLSFLGNIYTSCGKFSLAEPLLKQAISLKDDYPVFHYRLSVMYKQSGRISESRDSLLIASRLEPENVNYKKSID